MASRIKQFISKRFSPVESAKKAAIDYITTAGFFGDQMEGVKSLDEDDIIDQSAKFSQAFIPFLNTRKDTHMRELLKRYLENNEQYKNVCSVIKYYEDEKTKDELDFDIKELKFTKTIMHQVMINDGKIILSLTFPKIDTKTIVLDKPYIMDSGGKTILHSKGTTKIGEDFDKGN